MEINPKKIMIPTLIKNALREKKHEYLVFVYLGTRSSHVER